MMSKKFTIKTYSVETIKPSKRPGIWVHCEPSILRPLAYLQRPSWVNDEQWERILKAIRINAEPDMLNCGEGES